MMKIDPHPLGACFWVRAAPGARRNGVIGLHQGQLKVAVTQVPEKGKANRAIMAVLAEKLALRKSQIELLSGELLPEKHFLVRDLTPNQLAERIALALSG